MPAAFASPALAGPYTRLQVLLPGETAAPGTGSGKTGTPRAQVSGIPFDITVRACDNTWNLVTTVSNSIQITSSDASATLPQPAQLQSGTRTFTVTTNAGGNFHFLAHDQTDNTIADGVSATFASQVLASFTFENISQKHKYAGVPDATTLTARDPNGNVVTGYTGPAGLKEITSFGEGRVSPTQVTLTNGVWSGNMTMFRADETSINRGNVNKYAYDLNNPAKNGSSDPFIVHPGPFAKVQIIVPGMTPLPGSISGFTGSPATQAVGTGFTASVYATDAYWNPVPSGDNVRTTATGSYTASPTSGVMTNGFRQFTVTLNTVGTQTVTASDLTNGSIQSTTSPGITVLASAPARFAFVPPISSPQTAGVPSSVTIHAVDSGGNLVPGYTGDAILTANTGTGSISPEVVTFTGGVWTGLVTFKGAGGAVALTCADYSAPPKTGTSNNFVVNPGAFYGLQVLLPGESARGGTATGKTGTPTTQSAGSQFTTTVRAVDQYWNLVSGVNDRIVLTSTDTFAWMPSDTVLVNGQCLIPTRLHKSGYQTITARDSTNASIQSNTSSQVLVVGGSFAKVLILAPGEINAPGTATGRAGTPTDQSINYAFTVTVLATDQWWNPVGGATDVVRITSNDALAVLPPDEAMVDGMAEMQVRLSTGGFQQISVSDVTNPSRTGSTTQVRAISSGFHLEAAITPSTARAGEPFNLTVKVTNDAGSVIQEINSFVTLEVRNANDQSPGRGALLTTQFQLLQGQRTVSETYTYSEPIIVIARDDAGNAPATSNPITITPGQPSAIRLSSNPSWVGGNKHATITARVVDDFENGVPDQQVDFSLLSGTGTISPIDTTTSATGEARCDFLSPRYPEVDRIRATSGVLLNEMDLEVAFVDPTQGGGYATNYPNPFHPPSEPTTIAYKLDDNASVTMRIYTQSGSLVKRVVFDKGVAGGMAGLNEYLWDGKNGKGEVVSSGGYVVLIEAQGTGETLHVIRRKIAVVR
ncbi:MAG TPA: FlgD immunoglobulin-like domain containing protein [Candidatus Eisenbacteria bacterium]|nr:FlgD immunoglobulin-like domain containing protein [Candidatus Eisenbacteria bacterium]